MTIEDDKETDITRFISARYATEFERGLYIMGTLTIERVDLQLSDEEIKLLEKARSNAHHF